MDIFRSILTTFKLSSIFGGTTFKLSSIFGGSWCSFENWLEPKTEPPSENLACPNP